MHFRESINILIYFDKLFLENFMNPQSFFSNKTKNFYFHFQKDYSLKFSKLYQYFYYIECYYTFSNLILTRYFQVLEEFNFT